MKYLLDTCVISELVKPHPHLKVLQWTSLQPNERLFLSVLTLGELTTGVSKLPVSRKKEDLESWIQNDLKLHFKDRWLAIDTEIAERWGRLQANAVNRGKPRPVIDGLLAATAIVHGMVFVTRNEADVSDLGVTTLNPWNPA